MRLLSDVGLLAALLPEASDVPLALHVLVELPGDASFPLALAALLQNLDSRDAGRICMRLKLSNAERDRIEWLVWHHNYLCGTVGLPGNKLKPVLAHDGIRELIAMHRANAIATGDSLEQVEFCEQKLREWPPDVLNPHPLITGEDLLALGVEQGPIFKQLLDLIRAAQLNGRIQTKEGAIELVRTVRRI